VIALVVALGLLTVLVSWIVATYRGLAGVRRRRDAAWGDVEFQIERRCDLAANLVEMLEGPTRYALAELRRVEDPLARPMGARGQAETSTTERMLTDGLKDLLSVAETHPALRGNPRFLALQEELAEVEDAIRRARRRLDAVVRDLNTRCESLSRRPIALAFGFQAWVRPRDRA
jgi:LemA protein